MRRAKNNNMAEQKERRIISVYEKLIELNPMFFLDLCLSLLSKDDFEIIKKNGYIFDNQINLCVLLYRSFKDNNIIALKYFFNYFKEKNDRYIEKRMFHLILGRKLHPSHRIGWRGMPISASNLLFLVDFLTKI